MTNWVDEEVEFYDFIWIYGIPACSECINKELQEDFIAGGDKFERMKAQIFKEFPTRDAAMQAFIKERE